MNLLLVYLLPAALYCVTILVLVRGLGRITPHGSNETPSVSVIVAARNEEENIRPLLNALREQSYSRFEICLIDDGSSDKTHEIVAELQRGFHQLKVLRIGRDESDVTSRKKRALTRAIEASMGDILLFTDADCIPPPGWITGMMREFDPETGVVVGFSPYINQPSAVKAPKNVTNALLQGFIRYEEVKGALLSASSIGLHVPWLCTGRNLAYRRSVWNEVGGFQSILQSVGGDDDLFLQLVSRKTHWKIQYSLDPHTFVPTTPPLTFRNFLRQRTRHFSAGRFFPLSMKVFSFGFHTSNLLLFLGLPIALFWPEFVPIFLSGFAGKVLVDFLFVFKGAQLLRQRHIVSFFLPMELIYVCYATIMGPLGLLSTFEWKPDPRQ